MGSFHGEVFNVMESMKEHPGGSSCLLLDVAGTDGALTNLMVYTPKAS
jgi:hypothetical protein